MSPNDSRAFMRGAARGAGPTLDVQLFERRWYREFAFSTVLDRFHESDAAAWGLALAYDQAVVNYEFDELVVVDGSGPMAGSVEVTLQVQDSSDGLAWSDLLVAPLPTIDAIGSGRVTIPAPFASHLRVLMMVKGTGGLGLAHGEVAMTLRRREVRGGGRRQGGALPYPDGVSAAVQPRSGGCGGGCGGGCSAGDCGCGG